MSKMLFDLNVPTFVFREGKYFIAYSPLIDLSTAGKSYKEAERRFQEAAEIFFEEIIAKGTLQDVLSDLGWKLTNRAWQPPTFVGHTTTSVKLPAA